MCGQAIALLARTQVCAGLLICRSGASRVTGVEINQHMSDVATQCVLINGYGRHCTIINKDLRRVNVSAEGVLGGDLLQKADICIFEVGSICKMTSY